MSNLTARHFSISKSEFPSSNHLDAHQEPLQPLERPIGLIGRFWVAARKRPIEIFSPMFLALLSLFALGNLTSSQTAKHPAPWVQARRIGMSEILEQGQTMADIAHLEQPDDVRPMLPAEVSQEQAHIATWVFDHQRSQAKDVPQILPLHALMPLDAQGLPRVMEDGLTRSLTDATASLADVTGGETDRSENHGPAARKHIGAPVYELGQVQQALKLRGYSPGAVDGVMGPRTQRAIRSFQRDHGWDPDGHVDDVILSAIGLSGNADESTKNNDFNQAQLTNRYEAPIPQELTTGSIPRNPNPRPTRAAMAPHGFNSIFLLEKRLFELGYNPGPVDGVSDQYTTIAIKAFEKANGLPLTGRMSRRLLSITTSVSRL